MEDDLNILVNGRIPHFFHQMDDSLNILFSMEDDLKPQVLPRLGV
jgi:hypothetical protein